MKDNLFIKTLLIIIVILLALNIILPILSNPVPSYAAKSIQYRVVYCNYVDARNTEEYLNMFGKEGWELISAPCLSGGAGIIIFKR